MEKLYLIIKILIKFIEEWWIVPAIIGVFMLLTWGLVSLKNKADSSELERESTMITNPNIKPISKDHFRSSIETEIVKCIYGNIVYIYIYNKRVTSQIVGKCQ